MNEHVFSDVSTLQEVVKIKKTWACPNFSQVVDVHIYLHICVCCDDSCDVEIGKPTKHGTSRSI